MWQNTEFIIVYSGRCILPLCC